MNIKFRKKFLTFVVSVVTISNVMIGVSAFSLDESTRGPVCETYRYYKPSSTSNKIVINKEGEFKNSSSQSHVKTVSYSTTYSSSVSTGITADFNAITTKLGVSAKVSAGKSVTETETTSFTIGPKSIGYYKVGQKKKNTSGYIVEVLSNCKTREKYVTSLYSFSSYASYSDKEI